MFQSIEFSKYYRMKTKTSKPNPVGRPELPAILRRSKRIQATFTVAEEKRIRTVAGDLKLPQWLRETALSVIT